MSHELSIREDGTVEMAWFGEAPWHSLGTQVEERMTAHAARKKARIDVDAEKVQLFYEYNGKRHEVDDKMACVRADNGLYYGTVGSGYRILQTSEQAAFIDALAEGGAVVETVGALYGGARTFWACKIHGAMRVQSQIKDDRIDQYLTVFNGHDGTCAFRAFWSKVRVVCANTWRAAASGGGHRDGFSIRHTTNVQTRVKEAARILGIVQKQAEQEEAAMQALADARMKDRAEALRLLDLTFGEPEKDASPASVTRLQNTKERVLLNMLGEARKFRPGTKGYSRWDLFNGITYYTNHQMGVRETEGSGTDGERQLDSILLGSGNRIAERALEVLQDKRLAAAPATN